jgi:8-oxo-dGTP diphosphatase
VGELNSSTIRAAGGVVWRQAAGTNGDSQVEVAIIHRPRYDDWSMPKGKLNPGEIELEGAVREIAEETGYRVTLAD